MIKQKLNELIGLPDIKAKAIIQIRGCREANLLFPHTLLTGIGGTGKTAFARAIGTELGYHFVEVEAIVFTTRNQILDFLLESSSSAQAHGLTLLLFIDEIHRLRLPVQEALYIPMMEWRVTSRSGNVNLPRFTLMGATTRFDMLDANSFVTRFENVWEIERYNETDIGMVVAQQFRKSGLHFSREIVQIIAKRCLGIPRHAVSFVRKLRFYARQGAVHLADVIKMFQLEKIDELGLHPIHRFYLQVLKGSRSRDHGFSPLGVGAIASTMRQPEDMIKGAVEPILLELGMIAPTPRGRILTEIGHDFLEKIS